MNVRDAKHPGAEGALPAHIGRYRIIDRLGKGAMGVVYRARDEQLGRTVAVKVLMTDFAEEPDVRARFYREAQSAGRLLHRNIITIFDLGDDRGRAYIVMELLAGATLADYMTRPEAADLESKLDLMAQVCDGLSAAHAAGIIHRDIKPSNLFVLNDGGLKILDFGVARLVTSSMTVRGHIIGTPSYMSPEQATGRDIDHRSDVFSAGGVFYWMLTGRKPFAASDLPSVLRKVQFEDPPALREHEAPAPLARVVFRALAKDPGNRYQRISDMLGDLLRFRRQVESDALRLGGVAQAHIGAVQALCADTARLAVRLGSAGPQEPDALAALRLRHPILAERGLAVLGTLALRQAATAEILRELERVRASLEVEQAALRTASQALDAGEALLAIGDHVRACEQFEAALAACPSAVAAEAGVARCRRALAERAAAGQPPARAVHVASAPEAVVPATGPSAAPTAATADPIADGSADAGRQTDRMREALSRAREARRLRRAAWFRVAAARLSVRLGRFQRAHDAASAALVLVPGDAEAEALRAAAAAAMGTDVQVTVDATPSEADALSQAGPAFEDETVGTGTTVSGRAPE
jgi:eukaryotic-like serine/threonine-protein kinase